MTWRTALVAAAMLELSCLGGDDGRPLGRSCTDDDDCDGLRCEYGRCRAECLFDRDCPDGAACVASEDDPTVRVCTLPEEAGCLENGCEPPLVCDGESGLCREECDWDHPCEGPRVCRDGVCVETCGEAERCNGIDDDCDGDVDEADDGPLCPAGQSCEEGRCGAAGTLGWSHVFTGDGDSYVRAATVDHEDNVVVAGDFSGTIDLPEGAAAAMGVSAGYVAVLSADGEPLRSAVVHGSDEVRIVDVAADHSGRVALCGIFRDEISLPDGSHSSAGDEDAFAVVFEPTGAPAFGFAWGGSGNDYAASLAFDEEGSLIVVGSIHEAASIGGEEIAGVGPYEGLVLSFSPEGELDWHSLLGGEGLRLRGLALTAAGDIVVAGWFFVSVTIDGREVLNEPGSGQDGVVAALSADGAFQWGWTFGDGGAGVAEAYAVAAHPSGAVLVGGGAIGSYALCGEPVDDELERDALLLLYEPDQGCRWARTFGGVGYDAIIAVDTARDGRFAVAGIFEQSIDLGSGPRASAGDQDLFAASFDPDGTGRWDVTGAGELEDHGEAVARHPAGAVVAGGTMQGTIAVGGEEVRSGDDHDGYVLFLWD